MLSKLVPLEEYVFSRYVMDFGTRSVNGLAASFDAPKMPLPAFLSRKALVEQSKDFRNVELHVFQVEIFLIIFLHLQKIVKLQVQFQQSTSPA